MTDVVITEMCNKEAVDQLAAEFKVHYDPTLWSKRAELEKLVADLPALIVRNRTPVDKGLIDKAKKLKVLGRLGVGLDNIDVKYCESKGVPVKSARGGNAVSVAEYAIAMAMILLRKPAYRGTERLVAGEWPREAYSVGLELSGKRLGIIGLGSIGSTTAKKARALDMEVIAADPYLGPGHAHWQLAREAKLDELLATSDVITIHTPLTAETRGMINAAALARMKKGAILINSARGGIVEEAACAAALRNGHLGGAALDVFDMEPILKEAGGLFAGIPNVILTPHISGVTVESNLRVGGMIASAVAEALRGRT